LPFLLLYVGGFGYVAFCSLWHSLLDRGLSLTIIKRYPEPCPEPRRRAVEGRERVRQMGPKSLTRGAERNPESRKPSLGRA
jgi:hypothetical protein